MTSNSSFIRLLIAYYKPEQHPSERPHYREETDQEFAERIETQLAEIRREIFDA